MEIGALTWKEFRESVYRSAGMNAISGIGAWVLFRATILGRGRVFIGEVDPFAAVPRNDTEIVK